MSLNYYLLIPSPRNSVNLFKHKGRMKTVRLILNFKIIDYTHYTFCDLVTIYLLNQNIFFLLILELYQNVLNFVQKCFFCKITKNFKVLEQGKFNSQIRKKCLILEKAQLIPFTVVL